MSEEPEAPSTGSHASEWERAYLRFESGEEEIAKFVRRLTAAGAGAWPRESHVLELFCGRGNGMHALTGMGFQRVEGVDLSRALLDEYHGDGHVHEGDCRELPLDADSFDYIVIQGGLHHLEEFPADLERALLEIRRVLRPTGGVVVVEPWLTPFLSLVHAACNSRLARRAWPRLDALATMIDHERETYEAWLARPEQILSLLNTHFERERVSIRFGKLLFVGRMRS